MKSYKVEIDGLEVSYKRGGSGKKILFIHGFGLGSWEYDKVVAECARVLRYESSQELVKLLPTATLKIVEDCGHAIQLEKPKEFAKLVREFVG